MPLVLGAWGTILDPVGEGLLGGASMGAPELPCRNQSKTAKNLKGETRVA